MRFGPLKISIIIKYRLKVDVFFGFVFILADLRVFLPEVDHAFHIVFVEADITDEAVYFYRHLVELI